MKLSDVSSYVANEPLDEQLDIISVLNRENKLTRSASSLFSKPEFKENYFLNDQTLQNKTGLTDVTRTDAIIVATVKDFYRHLYGYLLSFKDTGLWKEAGMEASSYTINETNLKVLP